MSCLKVRLLQLPPLRILNLSCPIALRILVGQRLRLICRLTTKPRLNLRLRMPVRIHLKCLLLQILLILRWMKLMAKNPLLKKPWQTTRLLLLRPCSPMAMLLTILRWMTCPLRLNQRWIPSRPMNLKALSKNSVPKKTSQVLTCLLPCPTCSVWTTILNLKNQPAQARLQVPLKTIFLQA